MALPVHITRLPLSPHCNPFLVQNDSLGVFHHSLSASLASFAAMVSESKGEFHSGREWKRPGLSSAMPTSRQATSAHSVTAPFGADAPHCRFIICFVHSSENTTQGVRLCTRTGLHRNRVGVTMPLEIALSPQARKCTLPPSTHPKLGVSSRHQRFHRYALRRIFRPSLGNGRSD